MKTSRKTTQSSEHLRSFYGGRTESIRLHYNVGEGQLTIQYVVVMSLFPYVYKYLKFPLELPVIHVADACQDSEIMLRKEGLIKCSILPAQIRYHPVLHFRYNSKHLLCLCMSCATKRNADGECSQETVAERVLTGTWAPDEVRLVVQKSYDVIEYLEVRI